MKIKFFPDFFCHSLWLVLDDGNVENIPSSFLKISSELSEKISSWEEQYDSIFNELYPPESDFSSEKEKLDFIECGKLIYKELERELPDCVIEYIPPF